MTAGRAIAAFLAFAVLALVAPVPGSAQPSGDAPATIARLIERQIEAFRQDDGALAFSLASPNIQRKFGTAETFMRMVAEGYQPVYRPRSLKFLELIERDGTIVQRVMVEGPDGRLYLALYPMVLLEDGTWRIDGCYLLRAPGEGA